MRSGTSWAHDVAGVVPLGHAADAPSDPSGYPELFCSICVIAVRMIALAVGLRPRASGGSAFSIAAVPPRGGDLRREGDLISRIHAGWVRGRNCPLEFITHPTKRHMLTGLATWTVHGEYDYD